MTTNLDHNPSYVWRSILKTQFIIRWGASWCIGTNNSISILNEPSLVNSDQIDDTILGAHYVNGFSVSSLINHSLKAWN